MKKFFAIFIAFVMIFGLAACGGSKENPSAPVAPDPALAQPAPAGSAAPAPGPAADVHQATVEGSGSDSAQPQDSGYTPELPKPAASKSRMAAFVENYVIDGEYSMGMEIEGEQILMALKGDYLYAKTIIAGEEIVMVHNGDGFFMLMPSDKMGFAVTDDESGIEDITEIFDDFNKDEAFTTGEMTVEGKSYYYEEFIEKDDDGREYPVRYCFDGDDMKYVVSYNDQGKEEIMKILSFGDKVDDSVFTVPPDYEIMSF